VQAGNVAAVHRVRLEFWAVVRAALVSLLLAGVIANVLVAVVLDGTEAVQAIAWISVFLVAFPLALREARR
jgi:hypothetical protein